MKRKLATLLMCGLMMISTLALTACGGSEASLVSNHASGLVEDYTYGGMTLGTTSKAWDLKFYDNGSYEMLVSDVTIMSEMAGGVATYTLYGTYTDGSVADGYHAMELATPERVVYSSYSTLGGYAFDYDSNVDTEFIIPGGDDVPMSKVEFLTGLGCGSATTIYIVQDAAGNDTGHFEFEMK